MLTKTKPLPIAAGASVRNPDQQGGALSQIPTFHSGEAWSSPGMLWLPIRDSKGSNLSDRPRWAAFTAPYHIPPTLDPPIPNSPYNSPHYPPKKSPAKPILPIFGTPPIIKAYRPPQRVQFPRSLEIAPLHARRTRATHDSGQISRYARCSIIIHKSEALP